MRRPVVGIGLGWVGSQDYRAGVRLKQPGGPVGHVPQDLPIGRLAHGTGPEELGAGAVCADLDPLVHGALGGGEADDGSLIAGVSGAGGLNLGGLGGEAAAVNSLPECWC